MKKAEKILIVLFIIGQVFRLMYLQGGEILSLVSAAALGFLYLFFGFALLNDVRFRALFKKKTYAELTRNDILLSLFAGAALFIAVTGGVFKLQFYGGADLLVDLAFVLLVAALVMTLIFYFSDNRVHFKRSLERLIPYCTVMLVLVVTPISALIDIYYRDYPEQAKELKEAFEESQLEELMQHSGDPTSADSL